MSNLSKNNSEFWQFCDILHRFKKILAVNYKKEQCYGIAWLFHFKMSSNTARYVGLAVPEIIDF